MNRIFSKILLPKFTAKYSNKNQIPYDEKVLSQIKNDIPNIFEKYMNGEELSRKEEIEYQTTLNRAVYKSRHDEMDSQDHHLSNNENKIRSERNEEKKKKEKFILWLDKNFLKIMNLLSIININFHFSVILLFLFTNRFGIWELSFYYKLFILHHFNFLSYFNWFLSCIFKSLQ